MYICTHSYYSFKYGTMSPKELLEEAQMHECRLLALTDINSSSGSLYYAMYAQKMGINPVLGVDFWRGDAQQFVAIAKTNKGLQSIHLFLSDMLAKGAENFALWDSAHEIIEEAFLIYPLDKVPKRKLAKHEFIGIQHSELLQFGLHHQASWPAHKCVALNTASFRHKRDFNAHRLLRAIDQNILLSQLTTTGSTEHRFRTPSELLLLFKGYEFLLDNASKLLSQCSTSFAYNVPGESENKACFTQSKVLDIHLLRTLAQDGLHYRFGKRPSKEVLERMEMELRVIQECNFVPYFLINHSIVNYARSKGYFYVGRGSGANSLVAYLLKITNVDPVELDLYFERFINPSRKSPPDFDIDFSWRDRNDVTKFIFDTFPNTALMGAFVTFQQRSVIREIGKVLGLPGDDIKYIQRSSSTQDFDQLAKLTLAYSHYIHGLPNYLSIHSSGIVITEKPIQYFGATSMPPKGFPTAHFDMHIAEDAGIYKYDILAQRGLGKIKDTMQIIAQNKPDDEPFDIDDIARFKKDEKVKELLRTGRSIGCFYVESPAMRALMQKLQVDDYKGLVAASSIIRPGVSQSGMMTEYIRRHRDPQQRKAIHPVLGEILHETYGIMVYQEDVLRVAHYFAGLSLEESDKLRRGMSWKFRERPEFLEVKDKFYSNCKEKGYTDQLTTEIWRQIESFANYAFAKGHSASYAVESYQSLFLKAYYPLEYMVATVNNFGGFYRTEQYLQEARLSGATVSEPCVNQSAGITLIKGSHIIIGFQHIKNLEMDAANRIVAERQENGEFKDLEDFIRRVGVSLETATLLVRINAFRFTQKSKGELLWKAHFLLGKKKKSNPLPSLFKENRAKKITIPTLEPIPYEDAYDEIEYLGFPLCSPFDLVDAPELENSLVYADFKKHEKQQVSIVGYLVHTKRTKTKGRVEQEMKFGTFMDLEGQFFDSVHFPYSLVRYKFKGRGIYKLVGKVTSDFGHYTLETSRMEKIPYTKLITCV